MGMIRTAGRVAAAVCGAVAFTALAAAPAQASAAAGDARALDFQGRISKYTPGLSCSAVPIVGGGTTAMTMLVTSDSSKRVATVRYSLGGGIVLGNDPYVVGEGKIMVLKGTQSLSAPPITAERPGPPAHLRDVCSYGVPGASGWAELVHLQPVKLPTAAEVTAWCQTQAWYPYSPGSCPTYLLP